MSFFGFGKKKAPEPPPKSAEDEIFDKMFEFKMTGKQFTKESKKAEARQKANMEKAKKAVHDNHIEEAKQYAAAALKAKNECARYKVLGTKMEGVAAKLDHAYKTMGLTNSMKGLVEKMGVIGGMNDVTQMMNTVDQ